MTKARAFEIGRLALAAAAVPLVGWLFWAFVLHLGPNDFHDYWLAGRLLLQGHSPYDIGAITTLAASEHLTFLVGGGYSYPLPFALAMIPFGALPFEVAVVAFNALSLAAFGLTVAAWLVWTAGWGPDANRRRLAIALAAGLYPPVYGTVAMGQANLALFPVLGLGAVLVIDGATRAWRAAGGLLVGVAAVVKLVPGVLVVPLALGRRFGAAAGIFAGALGAFVVAVALVPWAAAGSGGLASLFDPDAFYTNQSINGFTTRLVAGTEKSVPLWSDGFDPRLVMLGLTAAFGLATLAVLWRSRAQLRTRRGTALGLGLALVAGLAGAPKTSYWNEALCLVAVGLLVAVDAPDARFGRFGRLDRGLLGAWFATSVLWVGVWAIEPARSGPFAPLVNLLWSSSLYGLLALWLLFVRRLRQPSASLRGIHDLIAEAGTQSPEGHEHRRAQGHDRDRIADGAEGVPGYGRGDVVAAELGERVHGRKTGRPADVLDAAIEGDPAPDVGQGAIGEAGHDRDSDEDGQIEPARQPRLAIRPEAPHDRTGETGRRADPADGEGLVRQPRPDPAGDQRRNQQREGTHEEPVRGAELVAGGQDQEEDRTEAADAVDHRQAKRGVDRGEGRQ